VNFEIEIIKDWNKSK